MPRRKNRTSPTERTESGLAADVDGADGQSRPHFEDLPDALSLRVQLPSPARVQRCQGFDGDVQDAAGTTLMPQPCDRAVDQQYLEVAPGAGGGPAGIEQ